MNVREDKRGLSSKSAPLDFLNVRQACDNLSKIIINKINLRP